MQLRVFDTDLNFIGYFDWKAEVDKLWIPVAGFGNVAQFLIERTPQNICMIDAKLPEQLRRSLIERWGGAMRPATGVH